MDEKSVIKAIEKKLKNKNSFKKEQLKDVFFNKLFILDYTKDKNKRKQLFSDFNVK